MNIMNLLENFLMPIAEKIGKNKYLLSIRDGFLISSPLLIVGSLFLLIANFPIPGWSEFWAQFFGEGWAAKLVQPVKATFDVMTIITVLGVGYSFGRQSDVDGISSAIIALVSFFILTPFYTIYTVPNTTDVLTINSIPLAWMGSRGIFVGVLTAIFSVTIFGHAWKKGWIITLPEAVPPAVGKSFAVLIPSAITILVLFVVKTIFDYTPYKDVHTFIYTFLQAPLTEAGNTLHAMVTAYIFLHLFWFFGINGSSVVGAVFNPVLRVLSLENLDAFQQGAPLPNIITGTFQDMFATFGGAGSTLSLLIACVIVCRSQRIRTLSSLSMVPGIFGINEPIIYGLPVMLNPLMLIPFMLVPTINIVIAYYAMFLGLVPYTNGVSIPWTTPIIISGFLVTDYRGAILQVLLLILGAFIYIPFLKIMDKQYLAEEATQPKTATDTKNDDDDFKL